jgi:hypothetical protein
MYFPKEQSFSRNCSSPRSLKKTPMARERNLREGVIFPALSMARMLTVKDSKRFAATGGWGYFDFNHFEPKAPTAKVKAKEECAFCHIASAKKDEVWTQFYRLLDK